MGYYFDGIIISGFICSSLYTPTLPAPSCGKFLKHLYVPGFLKSPDWLLESSRCFPEDGAIAQVCGFPPWPIGSGLFSELATCLPGPSLTTIRGSMDQESATKRGKVRVEPWRCWDAGRTRKEVLRGGTPRGSWVSFPLSTVSRSRILYLPFPPVSSRPKSWSSFLRTLGASGETEVSPAMTRMIRAARHPLAAPLFLGGKVATSRLSTLCRVSWGLGWGLGTFYHHLCFDKTRARTFCSNLLLERPVQMAGLLPVLSCPCRCPGQHSPVFSWWQ